ncbi:MAG: terminase large subunit [Butyricicoccus sp.]|nr:terminase large subunit [Butyricicoccus sp.]
MIDRVTEHAREVVEGAPGYGHLHRLACQRHLDDLARQRTRDFPFYWDAAASERVLEYAETLTIAEGTEPKPVKLIPAQVFDIGCTFGWKKTANNARRFRRRYKSMARQNGKTFENGIIGTYIARFSGYRHGKLFTVATKKRQARLAWEEMSKFVTIDPDLGELFSVKDYKSTIIAEQTACTIEALSREAGLDDGFRSIFSSIDELHQHKDNKIYKAIYNGTRSLPETLVSMITTRGDQLNSFCREMDDYAVKVLKGLTRAEDFFIDIYCLDPEDDIWDEANWIKANPFLCRDEEKMETLRQDAQTARDMGGSDLRDFLTKCMNMWVKNTDDQFIDPDAWKVCGSIRTLVDVVEDGHRSCWVGLDLSSGGDLTTLSLEFSLGGGQYYLYSHSFMPRGRLEEHVETDLAPYDLWEQQGLITVTGGSRDFMNDYAFIVSHLRELQRRYGLEFLGIGIDPHNAAGVMQELEALGCPVVTITQSARSLNDATVAIQLLVKGGQIEYDERNELLTWSMVNAALVRNSFEEIKVDKKPGARFKRIDPVDAVIDAHALMLLQGNGGDEVDVSGELDNYLAMMGWK